MGNEKKHIITLNKKASFSYVLSDFFTCGIKLEGSEIKSIRDKQVNIAESYCIIENDEVWVKNMDIARYSFCTNASYNPKKERKLLGLRKLKTLLQKLLEYLQRVYQKQMQKY